MLKRAGSDFRSKVSVRMMFIYAVVLIAIFGITIPAAADFITLNVIKPDGESISVCVSPDMSVSAFKFLILDRTNTNIHKLHIFFHGKELGDGGTLEKYRLHDGATLRMEVYDYSYPPAPEPTTVPVYEEPVFYALPEDEIGAYAIRDDGTKEYLLFHTYDICMDWLASDELCAGFERCFHKDGK